MQSYSNEGSFKSPEELAATLAYISGFGENEAAEHTQQYIRATTGAADRNRRGGVEGGETQGKYLESIGLKPGMTSNEIGGLIFEDTQKQEREQKRNNPGVNFMLGNYLLHKGYANQDERKVLGDVMQGMKNDQFKTIMDMGTPDKRLSAFEAMRSTEESLRADPTADARRTDVANDAADIARGTGPEQKYLAARQQAFNRISGPGKTYGSFEDSEKSQSYRGIILDEVQREINVRAKKAGVKYEEANISSDMATGSMNAMFGTGLGHGTLGGHPLDRAMTSDATRAKAYMELETSIAAKGGGGIDNKALFDLATKLLESSVRTEDAIIKGMPINAPGAAAGLLNAVPAGKPPR